MLRSVFDEQNIPFLIFWFQFFDEQNIPQFLIFWFQFFDEQNIPQFLIFWFQSGINDVGWLFGYLVVLLLDGSIE